MVTVLKNVTNVITACGEMYLFQKHHDSRVWAALFLMVCSISQKVNLFSDLVVFGLLLLPESVLPYLAFLCCYLCPHILSLIKLSFKVLFTSVFFTLMSKIQKYNCLWVKNQFLKICVMQYISIYTLLFFCGL